MTREDTKKLLVMIVTSYSKHLMVEVNEYTINLWHAMLKDVDAKAAGLIIQKWIMTEKYPPSIADIRQSLAELATKSMDASEGWREVMDAVKKYGSYQEDEALESLSPAVRAVVERFSFQHFCMMPMDEISTYFAQFRNSFVAEQKREKVRKQLPETLVKNLDLLAEQYQSTKSLGSGEE